MKKPNHNQHPRIKGLTLSGMKARIVQLEQHIEAMKRALRRSHDLLILAESKEKHMLDLYRALGVKWGTDPFTRINYLNSLETGAIKDGTIPNPAADAGNEVRGQSVQAAP